MPSYQSIFDRVGLLIAANVNALLDKALGANSIAVFDEYVNRMNGAMDSLITAEGVERGRARTLQRQIAELETETNKIDREVDLLLDRGERTLAASRQAVFNSKNQLLTQLKEDLASCMQEVAKLGDTRAKLDGQIEVVKAKRAQLMAMIAQKKAAEARYTATASVSTPERLQTDAMLERARQDMEIAHGKNEALEATVDARIDALLESDEIEVQLLERESRRLGAAPKKPELPEAQSSR
jgi:phage shock protein A